MAVVAPGRGARDDAARTNNMNIAQPQNTQVLNYLSRGGRDVPVLAQWNSLPNPYYQCGCHPEVVERLWDKMGRALPTDCRCLVLGTPALAHPKSGVILAIGIGTQYGLRLPGALSADAVQAGVKTHTTWSGGGEMDTRRDLGADWVFGGWLAQELIWCKSAYDFFETAATDFK